jgi:hypothetical protein
VFDGFIGQMPKGFEAIKAGKLDIQPWLSCRLNTENTFMDKPFTEA